MRVIMTAMGKDKPGIIAKMSAKLYEYNANILDVSQTVLSGDIFTMIMLIDLEAMNVPFSEFKEGLVACGKEVAMEVQLQREEIFQAMHRI